MLITLLAITKVNTPDRFCIAGMTDNGKWIRPIPNDNFNRFWLRNDLTRKNGEFPKSGDVWDIEGNAPVKFQYPNHREDFIITKRNYIKRLSNEELIEFLRSKVESESDFNNTLNANNRSLCLMKAKTIITYTSSWEGRNKPKIKFQGFKFDLNNPTTNNNDYPVKDCKWSRIVLQGTPIPVLNEIYFCIGLAIPSPFNGVEYPQMIGLHTKPEIPWPLEYPD
jgi:hypothetical protein